MNWKWTHKDVEYYRFFDWIVSDVEIREISKDYFEKLPFFFLVSNWKQIDK